LATLDEVLDRVAKAVEAVAARGIGAAMNEFNRRENGPAEQ
jgi:PTH1 family peptidyl-tRNA hydrolase